MQTLYLYDPTWYQVTDIHQQYQTTYTAPCNGIVSHGLNSGPLYVGFLLTTHAKANAKQMHSQSEQRFTHVCTHALDEPWLWENPKTPQIEPHAGIKMTQVLVSLVYICVPQKGPINRFNNIVIYIFMFIFQWSFWMSPLFSPTQVW